MKLNCDLGESFGSWKMGLDDQAMPHIHQANIACGFHAGDPNIIAQTLALAKQFNVEIGAHPSYPDLNGFGRRSMALSADDLRQTMHYQISALTGMAAIQGLTVAYVKPHGALYNDMMKQAPIRKTIMQAIADYPANMSLMLQATPEHERHCAEAAALNLPLRFEAFADRAYDNNGFLVSRTQAHAVHSAADMLTQVKQLVGEHSVTADNGETLTFPVDSICVHGDNEAGVKHIKMIREIIDQHEI